MEKNLRPSKITTTVQFTLEMTLAMTPILFRRTVLSLRKFLMLRQETAAGFVRKREEIQIVKYVRKSCVLTFPWQGTWSWCIPRYLKQEMQQDRKWSSNVVGANSYSRLDNLLRLMFKGNTPRKGRFVCNECGERFPSNHKLCRHAFLIHNHKAEIRSSTDGSCRGQELFLSQIKVRKFKMTKWKESQDLLVCLTLIKRNHTFVTYAEKISRFYSLSNHICNPIAQKDGSWWISVKWTRKESVVSQVVKSQETRCDGFCPRAWNWRKFEGRTTSYL